MIFLESNPLRFIETLTLMFIYARLKIKLFVFVFRKQTTIAPFWKGDVMWYCAMGNADKTNF